MEGQGPKQEEVPFPFHSYSQWVRTTLEKKIFWSWTKFILKDVRFVTKQPKNLQVMLCSTKIRNATEPKAEEQNPGTFRCGKTCHVCPRIKEGVQFQRTNTGSSYKAALKTSPGHWPGQRLGVLGQDGGREQHEEAGVECLLGERWQCSLQEAGKGTQGVNHKCKWHYILWTLCVFMNLYEYVIPSFTETFFLIKRIRLD